MAWIFITSLLAILFFVGSGYLLKEKNFSMMFICLILGLICLVVSGLICDDKGFNTGKKIGFRVILRARLNEPIDSVEKLDGYLVLNKSYSKKKINSEEPEKAEYLLELEDVTSGFRIVLNKVRVSDQKTYDKIESGRIYPPELEAELKSRLRDPNDPSPP